MQTIMIVASFPPLPAGGAEWQALRLGEQLSSKGVTVTFLTPGKGAVKGKTSMHGMTVYRFTSWLSKAFDGLSSISKTMRKRRKTLIPSAHAHRIRRPVRDNKRDHPQSRFGLRSSITTSFTGIASSFSGLAGDPSISFMPTRWNGPQSWLPASVNSCISRW